MNDSSRTNLVTDLDRGASQPSAAGDARTVATPAPRCDVKRQHHRATADALSSCNAHDFSSASHVSLVIDGGRINGTAIASDTKVTSSTPISPTARCAPADGWRRIFGDAMLVSGATFVSHIFGAITSLMMRVLLAPELMGIWQGLKLFLSYGNYAGLGVSKAAAREVSLARGSGQREHADWAVRLAFSVNTVTSAIYALGLGVAAIWIGLTGKDLLSPAWAIGLGAMAALTLLQRYTTFLITVHRARGDFRSTSIVNVIEAAVTLPAMLLGAWLFGLPGLYGAVALVMVTTLWYLRKQPPVDLHWAWDGREIRRLIGIGAPILLAGIASSLFRSLDKLMILGYLSDKEYQLGCYSLGLMVCTQLYGVANMLSGVMSPRYGEAFGRTGSHREVANLAAAASELLAVAVALPAGLAISAAPWLLIWLLPDYREGIAPMICLVPGIVAAGMAIPASQYLIAVNRGRAALGALLVSIGLLALGNHLVLTHGGGLCAVALSTSVADGVYLMLMLAVSFWPYLRWRERIRYVLTAVLPLVATMATGLAIYLHLSQNGNTTPWQGIVWGVLPVVAIWGAVAGCGWILGGWRESLRPQQLAVEGARS